MNKEELHFLKCIDDNCEKVYCVFRRNALFELAPDNGLSTATEAAYMEAKRAMKNWPEWNSAHEGFAVLLEEVDELKAHVWMKQKNRDIQAMGKEATQVAAMALRFATEICNEERGRR